jgi:hypothetical protein
LRGPIFTTSKDNRRLYVEPRAYSRLHHGLSNWVGSSSAVVRADVADECMSAPNYWEGCQTGDEVSDATVEDLISIALLSGYHTFTKRKTIKRNNDDLQKWLDIGVYTSDTTDTVVLLDEGLGQAPSTVYGHCETREDDEEHRNEEVVPVVVNHTDPKKVTLVAATYNVDPKDMGRIRRQLERAK